MRLISERPVHEESTDVSRETPKDNELALTFITIGLQVLSQRLAQAFSQSLPLVAIGSALWLWYRVMDAPSVPQLIGLGTYALFMLAVLALRRK